MFIINFSILCEPLLLEALRASARILGLPLREHAGNTEHCGGQGQRAAVHHPGGRASERCWSGAGRGRHGRASRSGVQVGVAAGRTEEGAGSRRPRVPACRVRGVLRLLFGAENAEAAAVGLWTRGHQMTMVRAVVTAGRGERSSLLSLPRTD